MNHKRLWPSRARSSPLIVFLAPAHLTCTQGRKKQTSTMIAVLVLMRRKTFKISPAPSHTPTPRNVRFWVTISHHSNDPRVLNNRAIKGPIRLGGGNDQ